MWCAPSASYRVFSNVCVTKMSDLCSFLFFFSCTMFMEPELWKGEDIHSL